jgi:hypothetical protein
MYSVKDTLAGGFPHSEISGSKVICHLPEAFRRLSRLSSPIIAKASTTCSYSLDPITLTARDLTPECRPGAFAITSSRNVCQVFHLTRLPYSTRFETLASKLNFCFDAIKMLLTARSARVCTGTVSVSNADFDSMNF